MLETKINATVLILARLNESSLISSAIAITSTSGTSRPIATTTPTLTAPVTANTLGQSGGGMSQSDEISLGVGIGLGFPSFIVALLSAWLAFRTIQRKRKNLTRQGKNDVESISTSTIGSGREEENGSRTP